MPGTSSALITLMKPETAIETRHQLARAIGKAGFEQEIETKLFELMKDDAMMNDAALALVLGGTPETAARAVALYAEKDKAALEELQDLWYRSFGYWSNEDLEKGRIAKWVDNAVAISRVVLSSPPGVLSSITRSCASSACARASPDSRYPENAGPIAPSMVRK